MQPIYLQDQASRPQLNVVGEVIDVLADSAATGSYEIFEQHGPEGSGPPPHRHPWDEAYFMLEGEMDVLLGDRGVVMRKRDFVHIPAGTAHCFRYRAGGGRFISVSSRGEVSAFFKDLDREVPPGPPDLPKVVAIAGRHQVELAGPPPA
jgi:mannose-6-phosphate isomerase-like protein (cupin superfamily)